MKTNLAYALITLLMLLSTPENVFATKWFVKSNTNGTGDSWKTATSIQNACQKATDGDIIYLAAGEYTLSQALNISKAISIIGGFTGDETSQNSPNAQKNRTILIGKECRAIIINNKIKTGETILIDGIIFEKFTPKEKNSGGAIFVYNSTVNVNFKNLVFKNCAVVANNSDNAKQGSNGGAIYFNNFGESVTFNIDNCTFDSCSAKEGGAIYINNANASTGKNIKINQCIFNKNYASNNGGGIGARIGNTLSINACMFKDNTASDTDLIGNGGAIHLHFLNDLEITSCTFIKNTATNKGSAICGNGNEENPNKINLKNCIIVDNYASRQNTGRFALDADNIGQNNVYTLTDCIIANNKNAKNGIADLILLKPSNKNTIINSIVNGNYCLETTADKINVKREYIDYLSNDQLNNLQLMMGIKDPSVYKK